MNSFELSTAIISCEEPRLGAGAGEAFWLVRSMLITESRNNEGDLDGGLVMLTAAPSDWLDEGKEIILRDCPMYYGPLSIMIRSALSSRRREIIIEHQFKPHGPVDQSGASRPDGKSGEGSCFKPAISSKGNRV